GQGAAIGPAGAVALLALAAPAPQEAKKAGGAAGKDEVEDGVRINIDTPVLKAIRDSLKKRFPKLEPLYVKGAVGEGRDGYLAAREEGKLSLAEKRDLKALVEEENHDRKNLYAEIVKANRFSDDRLKDVQAIFARKWIEKCRTGWWVQDAKGAWERKPPPPKEAEGKAGKEKAKRGT
ncbi:MAG: YdbL family protein, partial [Thermoanaerobaculia bacterium]